MHENLQLIMNEPSRAIAIPCVPLAAEVFKENWRLHRRAGTAQLIHVVLTKPRKHGQRRV
jgi:hypothetical protein